VSNLVSSFLPQLHLAVQTGNQGAVSLLLHHWQSAMDIVVGTVSTLAGSATPDDNNIDAASASIHDEIPNSIPEASSSSSSSKFPPGFGCWPFGAVRERNRERFKEVMGVVCICTCDSAYVKYKAPLSMSPSVPFNDQPVWHQ